MIQGPCFFFQSIVKLFIINYKPNETFITLTHRTVTLKSLSQGPIVEQRLDSFCDLCYLRESDVPWNITIWSDGKTDMNFSCSRLGQTVCPKNRVLPQDNASYDQFFFLFSKPDRSIKSLFFRSQVLYFLQRRVGSTGLFFFFLSNCPEFQQQRYIAAAGLIHRMQVLSLLFTSFPWYQLCCAVLCHVMIDIPTMPVCL